MKLSPQQWCHVPTKLNPADKLSRGMRVDDLAASKFWWEGPEFLKNEDSSGLQTAMKEHEKPVDVEQVELKKASYYLDYTMFAFGDCATSRLHPERFSDWNRLVLFIA